MTFDNICTKRTYKDKQGKEKTKWFTVGVLKTTDDGKRFLELNMFPGTPFYVFEQKERQAPGGSDIDFNASDLAGQEF